MRKFSYFAALFILASVLLFIDFYTKGFVYTTLPLSAFGMPIREIVVFQDFLGIDFSITLAMNKGMAWGSFQNFQYLILAVRMLVITAMLIYLFFVSHDRATELPLVIIVTGALGNVVDFFLYGSVIDFLSFNLWGYHFPVFNVADTLITIGVIAFFLVSFVKRNSVADVKN